MIPLFVCFLQFTNIPQAKLGAFYAMLFAGGFFAFFTKNALGIRPQVHDWVAYTGAGVIVAAAMRRLETRWLTTTSDVPVPLYEAISVPTWAGFAVAIWGWVIAEQFAKWCACVPERDITLRRRVHWGFESSAFRLGWRHGVACTWAMCGVVWVLGLTALFPIAAGETWKVTPMPKLAVGIATLTFSVGGLITVLTSGASPLDFVRNVWRALVITHTYDVPEPGKTRVPALGIFTFPWPFRDHRMRVLCTAVTVAICSVALWAATGWPAPQNLKEVYLRLDIYQSLIWTALHLLQLVAIAVVFLLWIFVTLVGFIGPICSLIYRDFAEATVRQAERSEF